MFTLFQNLGSHSLYSSIPEFMISLEPWRKLLTQKLKGCRFYQQKRRAWDQRQTVCSLWQNQQPEQYPMSVLKVPTQRGWRSENWMLPGQTVGLVHQRKRTLKSGKADLCRATGTCPSFPPKKEGLVFMWNINSQREKEDFTALTSLRKETSLNFF